MADTTYCFKLFISGMSLRSARAVDNLKHVCEVYLKDRYELEVIDINQDREQAMTYQIFALPTLLKLSPAPERIILGDLSDTEKVLRILNVESIP